MQKSKGVQKDDGANLDHRETGCISGTTRFWERKVVSIRKAVVAVALSGTAAFTYRLVRRIAY
ncbi:hypothetical protein GA0061084_2036 [Arthrobacter sp. NIO-1057]|nr:hypothetical protein GA0061084_2036 [Arthrobacter sp. NIO-1057]